MKRIGLWGVALGLLVAACGGGTAGDGKDEQLAEPGKADGLYGACEVKQVLAYVNDPEVTLEVMKADGIYTRSANNIIAYRNGLDGVPGTSDDEAIETIEELDDIYYVGPKTMEKLVEACRHRCLVAPAAEVIFSPQAYDDSHLARVAELIDSAEYTVDIAMYSFSAYNILDALERAVDRGVQIRFVFESANADRSDPEGSWSAKLEDLGIDVRYVNKIMHHKFAIIDGPYASLDEASTGVLVTGSGNWSSSAGTRYDENTIVIGGLPELLLQFQQEFNHIWTNSRDFIWDDSLEQTFSKDITDEMIADDAWVDVAFTSANFDTYVSARYGPTFSVIRGSNAVSDVLVGLIEEAEHSIHIASGHLRSRPVAEALLAKWAAHPEMDIKILLDNQEYISQWYNDQQENELGICLLEAEGSEARTQDCYDRGFYFSYPVYEAGIPLKFKYYCYRWHYSYAVQMHHKYMLFDGKVLASGSYNLSDNAEHNTIENMVVYRAERFPDLIQAFEDNFSKLWVEGEVDSLYADLMDEIQNGSDAFPIVFDPMALTWPEVTALKDAIYDNCPDINTDEYRSDPQSHTVCYR